MRNLNSYFDFSIRQLHFLSLLSAMALLMAGYLLVRSYAVPPVDAEPLPVFFSDGDYEFTGIFQLDVVLVYQLWI